MKQQPLVKVKPETEEEKIRYIKAYGERAMNCDQFREVMNDADKREAILKKQLSELEVKMTKGSINNVETDKIVYEAEKIFKTLDFNNKLQVVRDVITKVILKGEQEVKVFGRIPLFNLNMGYGTTSRNSWTSKCGEEYFV